MAEPIRKPVAPARRLAPHGARPHRPRPVAVADPITDPASDPVSTPTAATLLARPRTRSLQPVPEKRLRTALQTALGLHLAALLFLFLAPAQGAWPTLSDALLTTVVLLAGGTVLVLGRRSS